jgi:hypothetical protein
MSSVAWSIDKNHFKALEKHPSWGFTYWAFDLHSTIIIPNYDDVNIPKEFYPLAKHVLQELSKRDDIVMIMYTCSHPHEIAQYVKLFEENGIHFKYINNNPEVETREGKYGYYEDKFYFNVLFEDKAGFNAETDWLDVAKIMKFKEIVNGTNTETK